jgi:hypothetical protein
MVDGLSIYMLGGMVRSIGPGAGILLIMSCFLYSGPQIVDADHQAEAMWYIGEGLQENMQFKYAIQTSDLKGIGDYNMTILFDDMKSDNWLTYFEVLANGSVTDAADIVLHGSNLSPLLNQSMTAAMQSHMKIYMNSVQLIGELAPKTEPRNLLASSWGGLACEGCPRIQPHDQENITVKAGTFNATLITYGERLRVWVVDGFPYPVKGVNKEFGSPSERTTYSFELLEVTYGVPENHFRKEVDKSSSEEQREPRIFGTVGATNCPSIGGILTNDFTDRSKSQKLPLCKLHEDVYFLIAPAYHGICPEIVGQWTDPVTGIEYMVPTPCDVPRSCDPEQSHNIFRIDALEVSRIQVFDSTGNQHNLTSKVNGITCGVNFSFESKKLELLVKGVPNTETHLEVDVPVRLLSGNYSMLVDGVSVPFKIVLPSLNDIPDTASLEQYRLKFASEQQFDRMIELIEKGYTKSYGVTFFVTDEIAAADAVKSAGGTVIYGANNTDMAANVPIRGIAVLGEHYAIDNIRIDGTLLRDDVQEVALIESTFSFPDEPSPLAERRIELIGTSVVPEFPVGVFGVATALLVTLILTTRWSIRQN